MHYKFVLKQAARENGSTIGDNNNSNTRNSTKNNIWKYQLLSQSYTQLILSSYEIKALKKLKFRLEQDLNP